MPNLGYSHSLRYVDDETLARLDLSNVRTFGWGAEPIDPHKITEFVARFARAGLSPQAAVIGYGMAEYTLCVTVSSHRAPIRAQRVPVQSLQIGQRVNPLHTWDPTQPESVPVPPAATRGQPATLDLVGCGFPLEHTELAIRTYDGIAHSDYVVGEVLLRGHQPSLFSGNFPPAVTPMPVTEDDGWFNTGDLGYLVNGELFICGRQKDLLIVGGENILPDAIESIARQELGADARRAAAFGITNAVLGTEVPVLVCEAKGLQEPSAQFEAIRCIRRAVQSRLGINLGDAQLVRPGWIQVTTSGKLARQATRQKYLEEFGEPMAARVDVTQSEHAVLIASLMAEMLQLPDVGMDDDFFELGGDSLAATRFVLAVESVFGQTIPEDFYAQATVRHLVDFLARTER